MLLKHPTARSFGLLSPIVALALALAPAPLKAALPFISEIVPDNARTLADEDGSFPDWLEIHNPGSGTVNLQGWFLTDNPGLLTNWAFPSVNLPAGGFLVVFASGKNRTNDPTHLHTSFQLEASGEFLALVQPDGVTIASAFSPKFPSVKEDVSFGVAQSLVVTSLLNGSVPRVLVPTNVNDLPPDWNLADFVPGSRWTNGPTPPSVGFDTNQSSGLPSNVAPSGTAVQSTINGSFTPNLALNGNLGDFTHTLGTDTSPFWQVTLTNQMFIHSVVLHNRTSCCGSRLRDITIEILATNETGTVTNYTSVLLNPENAGFTFPGGPAALTNDLVAITGTPVLGSIVRVRRTPDPDLSGSGGQGNTDEAAVLSLAEVVIMAGGAAGLRPYFTTDLQSLMWNQNASAFVRLPFSSTNTPDVLTLKTRYDDGFIAYLNGVEIARRNAPASPQWDSAATADRSLTNAVVQETIDVSASIGGLVNGANVLGIHLLNSSAADPNALIQAELSATKLIITSNVYFTAATPGTNNNTGWYYDEVADTQFSVDRGFFTNSFLLEITNTTPGSQIYYSFNSDEPGPTKGFLYTGPILITNTTVVRTRAFLENWKPTDVDTATYLFLGDVIYQATNWVSTASTPPPYFPATWGANAVNYGMDLEVITNYTLAQWYEALTQIPSMSVVTEMRNLFDATTGIYANASQHGELWERPCSLELLEPTNAVPGRFQENCGLRIRGGFSRNADFRKHSLRVHFRREYGAGKLNYPLFEDEGADEFETFDLRTSQNYSWPRGSESPTFETMVREVFCRKTLGDMGQPYRRSRYYHLYLNGHYWGLYETDERPEASYGQTYFGGSKTNFDVVKCGNRGVTPTFATEATDGNLLAWSNLWTICQAMRTNPSLSNYFRVSGRNPDGSRNPELPVLIDLDNLIDYMLEIFYSGDGDATLSSFLSNNQANNWFGMRDRTNPDVGFRFFNSDCEHTLGSPSSQVDRTGPFGGSNEGIFLWSNPQWMHEELMRQLEYRVLFGDHVQKHFFNGGALTLQASTNRFIAKAKQITKAIRAYSARWGDANSATTYGETHWTNAIAFCLNWLPPRANIVLAQLTNDLLFPTISAPTLSSYGGFVSPGFTLTMAQNNPGGTIFYTTNGTDPRLIGGATSGAALTYSAPLTVDENLSVRVRVKVGTNWSAVVEALFTTTQYFRDIAITEIMYNPPGGTNVDGDEFEFLELKNTGPNNLNLSALSFTSGITFNFTNGTRLAPGAFFALARNKAQFQARYPGVTVNGIYTGRLANEGETLRLSHQIGGQIFAVTYDDASEWPQAADGLGFSIVPMNASTNLNSDQPQHWRSSSAAGGSPGTDDPLPSIPAVVVNEVLTHTSTSVDFIELYNPSGGEVNVSGWFLTDDPSVPKKYRIANGTIQAGGYLVITEPAFNPTPGLGTSFTLSAEGERVFLFSGDAATNLTGYSHGFNFGAAAEGVTFGRYVISTGEEQFPAQIAPTSGGLNSGPLIPNVVITELHYNPRAGNDAFVEIKNRSGAAVPLYDPFRPTNTWRLNGIDFIFPADVTLPAGGVALVVETPPTAFRAKYNVPAEIPVLGPYGGTLQDSGELVELQRLDFRGSNNVAWVTLDAVRYNDRAPWPVAADGAGASLQRISASGYGNDPTNWLAATPTPGGAYPAGAAPTITTHPASQFIVASLNASFSVAASSPGPVSYQWRFNGGNILDATNSALFINNVQPSHAGAYNVALFNAFGSAESSNAVLTVGIPASITENPTNISIRVPTDPLANPTNRVAVFRANAITMNPPLGFQWRFNSNIIAPETPWFTGVTSNILTLTNVLVSHGGAYDCAVSDALGTIYTQPATLSPLVQLTVLDRPLNQTNVVGAPFTVSATIAGSPPPFTYYWKSNSATIGNVRTNGTSSFFTITSVLNTTNTRYQLVVSNIASIGQGTQVNFTNTTVLDGDGDGIPDFFELLHGSNATDFDPLGDKDSDGMRNLAEYIAGTDPSDPASFLKIEQTTVPGAATVLFGAVPAKTYTVQYSDRIDGTWLKLVDIVSRTNSRVETIPDPSWSTNRFYRVTTPRAP